MTSFFVLIFPFFAKSIQIYNLTHQRNQFYQLDLVYCFIFLEEQIILFYRVAINVNEAFFLKSKCFRLLHYIFYSQFI